MKESFFKYLGTENDLSGYQKSYKLVLYKYLFEKMDREGYASAYDVTADFKNFYARRIKSRKLPDVQVDERIKNADKSSIRDIYAVINQNPYNAIHSKGYLLKESRPDESGNTKEYFRLAPALMAELTSDDISKIKATVEKKLAFYFSKIEGDQDVQLNQTIYGDADLQSLFLLVMDGYLEAKREPFSDNPMANILRNKFPEEIYKTGFITPEKYKVTGGPGQGNWASVPWIGIFNKSITTSATKGVYIVYLFSSDCQSVYLTLNQGCTELKKSLGKTRAVTEMKRVIEETIKRIDSRGFEKGDHIDLKDDHELPYLYERGTIFYKEYKKGRIPSNEILISDLKKMIEIYDDWPIKDDEKIEGDKAMTTKQIIEEVQRYIRAKGFSFQDELIANFYLSLKSKPFVILAGTSGTGKTRLTKLFAEAIGAEYKMVSVRPDWSDSSDLFGHLDLNGNFVEGAITSFVDQAFRNRERPYILCLDEMNLARVEYYLSDFLSVIETRDFQNGMIISEPLVNESLYGNSDARKRYGQMSFPENLYVIGTVNMDETTFPFSRKVLDRANTIEFSFVDLIPSDFSEGEPIQSILADNAFLKTEYLQLSHCEDQEYIRNLCIELQKINEVLMKAEANVGYRVRDEIAFYMLHNKKNELMSEDKAFDNEIMQKILPRIQGSSLITKNMLIELFQICAGDYTGFSGSSVHEQMTNYIKNNQCKYIKSASKICLMIRRFEEDGFTSYWL